MLNTVNSSTASAEGNDCRTSVRFFHRPFLAMRYQTSKGPPRLPCSFAASRSFFRLITCTAGLLSIGFADCEFVKRNFALCELDGFAWQTVRRRAGRREKIGEHTRSERSYCRAEARPLHSRNTTKERNGIGEEKRAQPLRSSG